MKFLFLVAIATAYPFGGQQSGGQGPHSGGGHDFDGFSQFARPPFLNGANSTVQSAWYNITFSNLTIAQQQAAQTAFGKTWGLASNVTDWQQTIDNFHTALANNITTLFNALGPALSTLQGILSNKNQTVQQLAQAVAQFRNSSGQTADALFCLASIVQRGSDGEHGGFPHGGFNQGGSPFGENNGFNFPNVGGNQGQNGGFQPFGNQLGQGGFSNFGGQGGNFGGQGSFGGQGGNFGGPRGNFGAQGGNFAAQAGNFGAQGGFGGQGGNFGAQGGNFGAQGGNFGAQGGNFGAQGGNFGGQGGNFGAQGGNFGAQGGSGGQLFGLGK